jgi:hypothetical protein
MNDTLNLENTRAKIGVRDNIVKQIVAEITRDPRNTTFLTLPANGWFMESTLTGILTSSFPQLQFEFLTFEANGSRHTENSRQDHRWRPWGVEEVSYSSEGSLRWADGMERVSGKVENCQFHYFYGDYQMPKYTTHSKRIAWADFCGLPQKGLVKTVEDGLKNWTSSLVYATFNTVTRWVYDSSFPKGMVNRGLNHGNYVTNSKAISGYFNDGRRFPKASNIFDVDYKGGGRNATWMKTLGYRVGHDSHKHLGLVSDTLA